MTRSKPKKRNLDAKKPPSRHQKIECPFCPGCQMFAKASMAAHVMLTHNRRWKDTDA